MFGKGGTDFLMLGDQDTFPEANSNISLACCEKLKETEKKLNLTKLWLILLIIAFVGILAFLVYVIKHPNLFSK